MSELILAKVSKYGNHFFSMDTDSDAANPREEYENLGTMICWHRNYLLGDVQESKRHSSPDDFFLTLSGIDDNSEYYERKFDKMSQQAINDYCYGMAEKTHVILPLYLYDHSGITMSTGSFGDRWDSGQVGYIYISHEKIREEYGWKKLTAKRLKTIETYLKSEVSTYDDYLTGNVYGFRLFEPTELDEEEINIDDLIETDSCSGFYGSDWKENGISDHVEPSIEYWIKDHEKIDLQNRQNHYEQLKKWIKNKVALMYRKPFEIA